MNPFITLVIILSMLLSSLGPVQISASDLTALSKNAAIVNMTGDVTQTPTADWPYPPPGETPTVEPTNTPTSIATASSTPSPTSTETLPISTVTATPTPTVTEPIPPSINVPYLLTLSGNDSYYRPGQKVTITWTIQSTVVGTVQPGWMLQFKVPTGWEPDNLKEGTFDPQQDKLSLTVRSLSGELSFKTAKTSGDEVIQSALYQAESLLSNTSISLLAERVSILDQNGGEISAKFKDYSLKLKIPKDALTEEAEVVVRLPKQTPGSLPLNGKHPFELVAKGTKNKNQIHIFNKSLEIEIEYNPDEIGIDPSVLDLFYFDEEVGTWLSLPSHIDIENHILRAWTGHFSLFAQGVNSFSSYALPPLDAAQVSEFTGSASYTVPIESPTGPGGIKASVSLDYNSMSVEGLFYQRPKSGDYNSLTVGNQVSWVGAGWSLSSGGSIMRNMGKDEDWDGDDTFSLTVGGTALTLVPVNKVEVLPLDYIDYKATNDNFWKIRRYLRRTDPTASQFGLESDFWVAWDKTGTQFTFGDPSGAPYDYTAYYTEAYTPAPDATNKNCGSLNGVNTYRCTRRPWGWFLQTALYLTGKSLSYNWTILTDNKCVPHTGGSGDVSCHLDNQAVSAYPYLISYPDGKTRIEFVKEVRPDYIYIWGDSGSDRHRYEKYRLASIKVEVLDPDISNSWKVIREYKLNYAANNSSISLYPESRWTPCDPSGNSTCSSSDPAFKVKNGSYISLLENVTQYGVGGVAAGSNNALPAIKFYYGQQSDPDNTQQIYNKDDKEHLTFVDNGQGGLVIFAYEEKSIDLSNPGSRISPYLSTNGIPSQIKPLYSEDKDFPLGSVPSLFRIDPIKEGESCDPDNTDVTSDSNCSHHYDSNGLTLRPGSGYRFTCLIKTGVVGTEIQFRAYYRENDTTAKVWSKKVMINEIKEGGVDVSATLIAPVNINWLEPSISLTGPTNTNVWAHGNKCSAVPVLTHYRVKQRIARDKISKQSITSSYDYTDPANPIVDTGRINDTNTEAYATANAAVTEYNQNNENDKKDINDLFSKELYSEFRGHGWVTVTNQDGKTRTNFSQDDGKLGQIISKKQYGLDGKLLSGQLFTIFSSKTYPPNLSTNTGFCPKKGNENFPLCFADIAVYWTRLSSDETHQFGAGVTETPSIFTSQTQVGRRNAYQYDAFGNQTTNIEQSWNGTAWVPYRATVTTYSPDNHFSNNGPDDVWYLVGLPRSTNMYSCPTGSAQDTCGSYAIDKLVASSCNLYANDPINGVFSGSDSCSKRGSGEVLDLPGDTATRPIMVLPTGKRTLLYFEKQADGITSDYEKPKYRDELFSYDAYGNLVKFVSYPIEGSANTRADHMPGNAVLARETQNVYDNYFYARPTSEIKVLGSSATFVTSYSYGELDSPKPNAYWLGLVKEEKDLNNAIATAIYDTFGRMKQLILPGDDVTFPTLAVDYYNFASVTAPAWLEVRQKMDGVLTPTTRKFFDGFGQLIQTQTANATVGVASADIIVDTTYTYATDSNNITRRMVKQSVPYTVTVGTNYRTPDVSKYATKTFYDFLGRKVEIVLPDSTKQTFAYIVESAGILSTKATDARLNITKSFSDGFGRIVQVVPPAGPSVTYNYDVKDQLTSAVYGNAIVTTTNATTAITYDLAGRKVDMTDADMGYWQYIYDALGNMIQQVDAKRQASCLYYDLINRLKGKTLEVVPGNKVIVPPSKDPKGANDWSCAATDPANYSISYFYDDGGASAFALGRRTRMTDLSGSTIWSYDARGRVTREEKAVKDPDNSGQYLGIFVTSWGYFSNDQISWVEYPNRETVQYGYLSQGALNTVSNYVSAIQYDAAGRVDLFSFTNGFQTDYRYNDWNIQGGRLFWIKTGTTTTPENTQYLEYHYDNNGNPDTIKDYKTGTNRDKLQTQSFSYDSINRLQTASALTTGGFDALQGDYASETYKYDDPTQQNPITSGNLINKGNLTLIYTNSLHKHAVSSSTIDGNTYTNYAYDANGNMIGKGAYTLSYDMENHLTSISGSGVSASYYFDGDGNRVVAKVGGDKTVYIGNYFEARYSLDIPSSQNGSSTNNCPRTGFAYCIFVPFVSNNWIPMDEPPPNWEWRSYYYAGTKRVAMRVQGGKSSPNVWRPMNGELFYLLSDRLGSTSITMDSVGTRVSESRYKPWGETRFSYGTPPTSFGYTGQRSAEAGLYFYGARWLDPYLNRFLSPDDIIPDQYDPQSWDRYSYVRNNPVNRVDPDGHKDREDCYNCPGGAATGPKNPLPPEKQWTVEEKLQEWEKAHPEYNNSTGSKSGRPDLFRGGNPPQGDKPGDPNFSLKTQDKPYKNGDWDITVDPEGNVEPGSGGLSTRSEPKPSWKAPWEYPSDSPDPEGIRIFQDQPDTDPLHWLWEPAWKMPFEDFKQFLQNTLQNWIPFSE